MGRMFGQLAVFGLGELNGDRLSITSFILRAVLYARKVREYAGTSQPWLLVRRALDTRLRLVAKCFGF